MGLRLGLAILALATAGCASTPDAGPAMTVVTTAQTACPVTMGAHHQDCVGLRPPVPLMSKGDGYDCVPAAPAHGVPLWLWWTDDGRRGLTFILDESPANSYEVGVNLTWDGGGLTSYAGTPSGTQVGPVAQFFMELPREAASTVHVELEAYWMDEVRAKPPHRPVASQGVLWYELLGQMVGAHLWLTYEIETPAGPRYFHPMEVGPEGAPVPATGNTFDVGERDWRLAVWVKQVAAHSVTLAWPPEPTRCV